jgi:hypothetical protein
MGKIGKEATQSWKANRTDRPDYDIKRKKFIKKCKDTKHVAGDLDGLRKGRGTCVNKWNEGSAN